MPNRIIKESICTSEDVNELSWLEEVFFYRLIVNCDDYGRFDARPAILKSRLFPLKDITIKQIENLLNKLVTVGMVMVYEYDRQPYLQLLAWEKHQQMRAKRSKYPAFTDNSNQLITSEIICNQEQANVPVIQSESESESELASEHEQKIFEVIAYLNAKASKRYDCKVAKNQEHISGRLNEGRTVEELKYVIDVKCEEWLESAEFNKNLNPVTLFRPSNFDRYVNQNLKNPPDAAPGEPAKTESEDLRSWQN